MQGRNNHISWEQDLLFELRDAVRGHPFWSPRLSGRSGSATSTIHLAVFVEPFLSLLLAGKKTVESRFSVRPIPPYNSVKVGDTIVLKRSAGPVIGLCAVRRLWFYHLDRDSWKEIRAEFTEALCAQDPDFWRTRTRAEFASLMRVEHVFQVGNIDCAKRDRRGWVILPSYDPQLRLGGV